MSIISGGETPSAFRPRISSDRVVLGSTSAILLSPVRSIVMVERGSAIDSPAANGFGCDTTVVSVTLIEKNSMKNRSIQKSYIWLLFLIPLFTSCQIDCPAFDRQTETLSLQLFPQDRQRYDFVNTVGSVAPLLRFERNQYEFSEAYKQGCGAGPCDCFLNHRQIYEEVNTGLVFINEILIFHDREDAISTSSQYSIRNIISGASDLQVFNLPLDNVEIRNEINTLLSDQLTVMNEVFNDVLRLELQDTNITLLIERDRGLQGIVYQDELCTLID